MTADTGPVPRPDLPRPEAEVEILVDGVPLEGTLALPEPGHGLVIFAHGSGSSRHSPRNRYVAQVLGRAGLGTLLFDLLTRAEEVSRNLVFDVGTLAGRLRAVTAWAQAMSPDGVETLRVGYFGASTGAAAALVAAASGQDIGAVVSRGGRPDLAGEHLARVSAPTLLIVGGRDTHVLGLNSTAQARLTCVNRLDVVPGASHLFEEEGTLATAAELARDWFEEHLAAGQP